MPTRWKQIAEDVPDFANAVKARFDANRHHLLATIRASGAPRLSGTEVVFDDDVGVGMMPDSHKLADVRRDPRVEIHSAPLEEDLVAGDAKLVGRLIDAGTTERTPGSAFVLDLEIVSLVQVDGDELLFTTWRRDTGLSTTRRS